MDSKLILFTLEFPYGKGEAFLENEISLLSKEFNVIYLLPATRGNSIRQLPDNVILSEVFCSLPKKLYKLFPKYLFSILRIYFWTLFKRHNFKIYLKFYKSYLHYLIVELHRITPLKLFIKENNLENAIYYDYWFVNSTLALAELKRENYLNYFICRAHGFDLYDERQFETRVPFRDYRMVNIDKVFCVSKHGYEYLRSRIDSSKKEKIFLSYLGVGIPSHFIQKANKDDRIPVIVSCARLIPLKRIPLIVDILRKYDRPIQWFHFGDGPEWGELEYKIRDLPAYIEVFMKGELSNGDVMTFYATTYVDVFISLSISEGLPVSILEAMSFGIPVLATDVNGVSEAVNDRTGVLMSLNNDLDEIMHYFNEILHVKKFDRALIHNFIKQNFNRDMNYLDFIKEIKNI